MSDPILNQIVFTAKQYSWAFQESSQAAFECFTLAAASASICHSMPLQGFTLAFIKKLSGSENDDYFKVSKVPTHLFPSRMFQAIYAFDFHLRKSFQVADIDFCFVFLE